MMANRSNIKIYYFIECLTVNIPIIYVYDKIFDTLMATNNTYIRLNIIQTKSRKRKKGKYIESSPHKYKTRIIYIFIRSEELQSSTMLSMYIYTFS